MHRRVSLQVGGLLRVARPLIGFCVAMMIVAGDQTPTLSAANAPLRTFWTSRASLESPDAVRRAVSAAAADSFDTVMVPVALVADAFQVFDGAREMVNEARSRGLRVHAWIEVTLVAANGELPPSREHVLYQHPEWLMVPRELAPEMLKVDVRTPGYLGRLSRWARANRTRVDGLYVSPLSSDAVSYLVTAVTAAAKRYPVDGVFLDAVRFPGADFDYSRHAMEVFRADMRPQLSAEERARLDEVEAIDPFGYAEELPERWREFRQSRLTSLVSRLRRALSEISQTLVVSAGVPSDPSSALAESFQDWTNWMQTGLVDGVGRRSGTSGTIVFSPDAFSAAPR
jgi:glycosyl hydrolase family 10